MWGCRALDLSPVHDSTSFWLPQPDDLNPQSFSSPVLKLSFLIGFILSPNTYVQVSLYLFTTYTRCFTVSLYQHCRLLQPHYGSPSPLPLSFTICNLKSSSLLHWTVLGEVTMICIVLCDWQVFLEIFSVLVLALPLLCLNYS